ncbi:1-deoxy-D-xylulose 5-phosphate reductoisomerase, putative [Eimeria acervulina]|uniref:1-deoxy-D-xylulose-5-phosphate reductoisomerase n=1 Tax=Eimeria acervulina TaxID=5801 RepID=U6GKS1_EIMAC|nr:1-deoxy-D-xylulose 5-phosphate reductoisomerase, putative [Eimeria acervulina]CDI80162.1 1-deoxy-D-xylulose 5-phosphate reductoisomerase, putative [Eimeria acervulina]
MTLLLPLLLSSFCLCGVADASSLKRTPLGAPSSPAAFILAAAPPLQLHQTGAQPAAAAAATTTAATTARAAAADASSASGAIAAAAAAAAAEAAANETSRPASVPVGSLDAMEEALRRAEAAAEGAPQGAPHLWGRPRCLGIFGCTGSIGRQALEVCRQYPHLFKVSVLAAAGTALQLLLEQALEFRPQLIVVETAERAEALRGMLKEASRAPSSSSSSSSSSSGRLVGGASVGAAVHAMPTVVYGEEALEAAAVLQEVQCLLLAVSGFKGLGPALAALKAGKDVALATKEALVAAGSLSVSVSVSISLCLSVSLSLSPSLFCLPLSVSRYKYKAVLRGPRGPPSSQSHSPLYGDLNKKEGDTNSSSSNNSSSSSSNSSSSSSSSSGRRRRSEETLPRVGRLLPVDSEHSALFQVLQGVPPSSYPPSKLLLCASGGPFLGRTAKQLLNVTVDDALKHPKWSMGKKITVDSATLMNKGLEVIEAHEAFGVPYKDICVLIHTQALLHSAAEMQDGSLLAQLAVPDMKIPIAYALAWPHRIHTSWPRLDLLSCGPLTFERPDT